MPKTFLNLLQEFNLRTNTPKQVNITPTDNNNLFISCFERALRKIETDGKWKEMLVPRYELIGDGEKNIFNMPDGFLRLNSPVIYDSSIKIGIRPGTVDEILGRELLGITGEALLQYTLINGKIYFGYAPVDGAKLRFSYYSSGIVNNYEESSDSYVPGTSFKNIKDTFVIDDELLIIAAQWFYAQQMGFQDADAIEADYNNRLKFVQSKGNEPFIKNMARNDMRHPFEMVNEILSWGLNA